MLIIESDDPQDIIALFCGPRQHDEHMKNWRWNKFTGGPAGYAARAAAVDEALAGLVAMRRAEADARAPA